MHDVTHEYQLISSPPDHSFRVRRKDEDPPPERSYRCAEILGDGWPTWMWAPDAEPGMGPQAAMNGIPFALR
jgi:hypothetical protein